MIKTTPWICILLATLFSCSEYKKQFEYFNDLGEIPFNKTLDNPKFKICQEDNSFPFNYGGVGLVYKGEKKQLISTFMNKYYSPKIKGQNGFITIRFIINCKGETGRFRVTEMGFDLKPKKFHKKISKQILDITKNLNGWKAFERNNKTWDYQQYLTFKFKDSELKEILP